MIDDRENTPQNDEEPGLPAEDAFALLQQERLLLEQEERKLAPKKQEQSWPKKKMEKAGKPQKRQTWNSGQPVIS